MHLKLAVAALAASLTGSLAQDDEASNIIVTAHGTLASIVFLVLFPIGAMVIRIFSLPVWVHGGIQIFAYCCYIAAAGLGIYIATTMDLLMSYHPIIGLVLLAILFIQPFFGLVHHLKVRREKTPRRTLVSHLHIWEGRLAIILGMVNGGLGIQLAGGIGTGYIVAYSVVAGVMGSAYLATVVFGEAKRRKGRSEGESSELKQTTS